MHVNARRHRQPLKEIQNMKRLSQTWQRSLPDERRPAFEKAQLKLINDYIRKGDRVRPLVQQPIQIHNGLMHEHDSRSARILDRTLRNGLIPHEVGKSFRDGSRQEKIGVPWWKHTTVPLEQRDHLPRVEVYMGHSETVSDVSHFNSKSSQFVQHHEETPSHIQVNA